MAPFQVPCGAGFPRTYGYREAKGERYYGCYGCADILEPYLSACAAVCTVVRLDAKRLNSGWLSIPNVTNNTSTPGTTNNKVRSNLLNAPASACEIGKRPM